MEESKALGTMEGANRIIEDFTLGEFTLYAIIFSIQVALCFWIGLKL